MVREWAESELKPSKSKNPAIIIRLHINMTSQYRPGGSMRIWNTQKCTHIIGKHINRNTNQTTKVIMF